MVESAKMSDKPNVRPPNLVALERANLHLGGLWDNRRLDEVIEGAGVTEELIDIIGPIDLTEIEISIQETIAPEGHWSTDFLVYLIPDPDNEME